MLSQIKNGDLVIYRTGILGQIKENANTGDFHILSKHSKHNELYMYKSLDIERDFIKSTGHHISDPEFDIIVVYRLMIGNQYNIYSIGQGHYDSCDKYIDLRFNIPIDVPSIIYLNSDFDIREYGKTHNEPIKIDLTWHLDTAYTSPFNDKTIQGFEVSHDEFKLRKRYLEKRNTEWEDENELS